jgi:hypothetical protein
LSKVRRWVFGKDMFDHARLRSAVLPFGKLALVECVVLRLQLAHFLDLVEVDHEALLVRVVRLNALPAEDRPMLGAVEMHDAVVVGHAKLVLNCLLVLIVEINCTKQRITLHDFIENVNVEWEPFRCLQVLH